MNNCIKLICTDNHITRKIQPQYYSVYCKSHITVQILNPDLSTLNLVGVSKVSCLYQPVWPSSWSCWLGICPGYEGRNSPDGGNRLVRSEGCWDPCLWRWCLLWTHRTDCPAGLVHCLPSDPQKTSDSHTIHSEHTEEAILRFYLQNNALYYPLKPSDYFMYQQGWHWQILHSSHRMHLCVLNGSQNKQRLYSCTVLTS
jgi:hypothetical protein